MDSSFGVRSSEAAGTPTVTLLYRTHFVSFSTRFSIGRWSRGPATAAQALAWAAGELKKVYGTG